MRGYHGYMLGNAVEFGIDIGEWDWALRELRETLVEDDPDYSVRFRIAILNGLRGDDVSDELALIAGRTAALTEIQIQATLDEGTALVELAQGRAEHALELAQRSFRRMTSPDSDALFTSARAAAWTRDRPALVEVLGILEQQPGRVPAAACREAQAALAALDGRPGEAALGFADAVRRWRELGLHVASAWAGLNWVTILGATDAAARAAAEEARATFERVGALPLLERLADAAGGDRSANPAVTRAVAEGVSDGASDGASPIAVEAEAASRD
jgi:hypothetical protein